MMGTMIITVFIDLCTCVFRCAKMCMDACAHGWSWTERG